MKSIKIIITPMKCCEKAVTYPFKLISIKEN